MSLICLECFQVDHSRFEQKGLLSFYSGNVSLKEKQLGTGFQFLSRKVQNVKILQIESEGDS